MGVRTAFTGRGTFEGGHVPTSYKLPPFRDQQHRIDVISYCYWYSCYCFKSPILFTNFKLFFSLIYGVDIMNAHGGRIHFNRLWVSKYVNSCVTC